MDHQTFPKETLAGRVAIVTGGGGGIGFGIAQGMVDAGAKVVLASRSVERLDGAVEALRARGGDAIAVQTDVRD